VGLTALAVLFLFAPAMSLMPQAVLAAIVVVYSLDLISLHELRAIAAVRNRNDSSGPGGSQRRRCSRYSPRILVAIVTSMVALSGRPATRRSYEAVRPGTVHFLTSLEISILRMRRCRAC
jgi:hypothetical protein